MTTPECTCGEPRGHKLTCPVLAPSAEYLANVALATSKPAEDLDAMCPNGCGQKVGDHCADCHECADAHCETCGECECDTCGECGECPDIGCECGEDDDDDDDDNDE